MRVEIPTVFAACAMCNLLIAAALLAGFRRGDWRSSGVGHVALGLMSMASGFGLLATRGALSPWLSIVLADALVGLSVVASWSALRQLYGQPGRPAAGLAGLALIVAADAAALLATGDSVLRAAADSALLAALFAAPGIYALRRQREWAGRMHLLVAVAMLAGSAVLLARALWALGAPSVEDYAILAPSPLNVIIALALYAIVLVFSLGFVLMLRERDLLRLAMVDALTGVLNRRAMMERMQAELAFARRSGLACAVLLADLDHFKRINDEHGHAAGDEVLRHFAALARALLRREDVLGRYGGEEFALLLPGTTAEGAQALARRLREALAVHPASVDGAELHYTASLGIAQWHAGSAAGVEELLAEADRALYAAKRDGRDRAVVFDAAALATAA